MTDRISRPSYAPSRREFFLSLLAAGIAAGLPVPVPVDEVKEWRWDPASKEFYDPDALRRKLEPILAAWQEVNLDSHPEMHLGRMP